MQELRYDQPKKEDRDTKTKDIHISKEHKKMIHIKLKFKQ